MYKAVTAAVPAGVATYAAAVNAGMPWGYGIAVGLGAAITAGAAVWKVSNQPVDAGSPA